MARQRLARRVPLRRPLSGARRLETSQAAASAALGAVASYLQAETELPAFFGNLTMTVAGLVAAKRVAFWRLAPQGALVVQREPFGFAANSRIRTLGIGPSRDGEGIAERIVLRDELEIREGTCSELDQLWRANRLRGCRNSIAVSWSAGDRRIGVLAAYDARRGFTDDDAWLLRIVATPTGLVWQYRQAQDPPDMAVQRRG